MMRKSTTESPTQLNTYEVLGDNLRIHFEEEVVNIEASEDFDASVSYKYVTAYTTKLASRAEKRKRIPQKLSNVTREMLGRCIAEAL